MRDLTAILLLYLAFGFKKTHSLAQNSFFVQIPNQKPYENTNPKGISDHKQEDEEGCCFGLATLTVQELCSACSLSANMQGWELILISACILTTSQELMAHLAAFTPCTLALN